MEGGRAGEWGREEGRKETSKRIEGRGREKDREARIWIKGRKERKREKRGKVREPGEKEERVGSWGRGSERPLGLQLAL